jgi:hypothetical protein
MVILSRALIGEQTRCHDGGRRVVIASPALGSGYPSAHVSTTLLQSPDIIASKPFWNSWYG